MSCSRDLSPSFSRSFSFSLSFEECFLPCSWLVERADWAASSSRAFCWANMASRHTFLALCPATVLAAAMLSLMTVSTCNRAAV